MRTGLPKSSVAPRRANITTPRCQSRAAAPRPRERSRHPHITALIVAERRHSAITRYAERSAACRDSTRPCCRRAGGTPLLQSRSPTARAVSPPPPHHHTHRRGATALCRNPVRGAQRSVPEVRHYSRAGVRPRERSRLQLTPDSVGGTRTDAHAPRSATADAPRAAERTKKSSSRGWRIQKYKCGLDYLTITLVAVPLARTT